MPRYRNMNSNQRARVQNQMQSGNYGRGAAGRVAQRRAGRINTTPQLVTDQAPAPQAAPPPMQPPPMDEIRPQMPMQKPSSGFGYAEGLKSMGGPASMQESYAQKQMGPAMKQPGMFQSQGGAQPPPGERVYSNGGWGGHTKGYWDAMQQRQMGGMAQDRGQMASQAIGQMQAKMPQQQQPMEQTRQWQDSTGLAQQKAAMAQRQPMQQPQQQQYNQALGNYRPF